MIALFNGSDNFSLSSLILLNCMWCYRKDFSNGQDMSTIVSASLLQLVNSCREVTCVVRNDFNCDLSFRTSSFSRYTIRCTIGKISSMARI